MAHPPPPKPTPPPGQAPGIALETRSVAEETETPVYLIGPAWGLWTHHDAKRFTKPCRTKLTNGLLQCGFCKAIGRKWRCYVPLAEADTLQPFVIVGGVRLGAEVGRIPCFTPCRVSRNKGVTARVRLFADTKADTAAQLIGRQMATHSKPLDLWGYLLRLWADRELAEFYGMPLASERGTAKPDQPVRYEPPEREPGLAHASEAFGDVLAARIRASMKANEKCDEN